MELVMYCNACKCNTGEDKRTVLYPTTAAKLTAVCGHCWGILEVSKAEVAAALNGTGPTTFVKEVKTAVQAEPDMARAPSPSTGSPDRKRSRPGGTD